jgi:hypothetical protein
LGRLLLVRGVGRAAASGAGAGDSGGGGGGGSSSSGGAAPATHGDSVHATTELAATATATDVTTDVTNDVTTEEPSDTTTACSDGALVRLWCAELGGAAAWAKLLGEGPGGLEPHAQHDASRLALCAVLDGCLRFDETERLTASDVLRLGYFAQRT